MSRKVTDAQGRWRSKTVSFRMSPEENALLDSYARLSGMTKQDYLADRVLQRDRPSAAKGDRCAGKSPGLQGAAQSA